MHQTAYQWIAKTVAQLPTRRSVLEIGSRDVNGNIKGVFNHADQYYGIDLVEGSGVDEVADAAKFRTDERFDTVVCSEVLEHTDSARDICRNAHQHLTRGGVFLVTAAGAGRVPHSASDGGELKEGEFYRNVLPRDLRWWLSDFAMVMVDIETAGDIYALAFK